jgi:hypothetical protein
MKTCTKCKKNFPATSEYFPRNKRYKDGLFCYCKECNKARFKKHYEDNKEYHLERSRKQKEEKPELYKQYRENSREHLRELNRKLYNEKRDYHLEKNKRWRKNNPEKVKLNDAVKRYNRKARKMKVEANFSKQDWLNCITHFDNHCAYCGKEEKLQQDHFVPLYSGGEYTINNIVPACGSCNINKRNRNFFEWYPNFKHYSKKREQKVLKYLKYDNNHIQQLSIL